MGNIETVTGELPKPKTGEKKKEGNNIKSNETTRISEVDTDVTRATREAEAQLKNSIEAYNLNTPELVDNYLLRFQVQSESGQKNEDKLYTLLQRDIASIQASWAQLENVGDSVRESEKNETRLQWLINNYSTFGKIGALRGKEGGNKIVMTLSKVKDPATQQEQYAILALTLDKGKPFGNGIRIVIPKPHVFARTE